MLGLHAITKELNSHHVLRRKAATPCPDGPLHLLASRSVVVVCGFLGWGHTYSMWVCMHMVARRYACCICIGSDDKRGEQEIKNKDEKKLLEKEPSIHHKKKAVGIGSAFVGSISSQQV